MEKKEIFDSERNLMGGLEFIDILVERIKKTSNKDWSKQQADFINSILRTANQDAELYMKVKNIRRSV